MSDEETAATLILVGAIIQIIVAIIMIIGGAASSIGTLIDFIISGYGDIFDIIFWTLFPGVPMMTFGIIGLILSILWLRWRFDPVTKKTHLIVTGVLALIFIGIVPGVLVLIGGAIAPSESA